MKKVLILIIILFCFLSSKSFAFPNEPNGFRDLYWGESLQDVQKNYPDAKYNGYHSNENAVSYIVDIKNPYISNVLADKKSGLKLYFWNNKLYRINFTFTAETLLKSTANYIRLRDAMTLNFGKPSIKDLEDTSDKQVYTSWHGNNTTILLMNDKNITDNKYHVNITLVNDKLLKEAFKDVALSGW